MSGKPGTRRSKRKKSNRPKRENDFRESLPADLRQQLRERYEERYKPGEGRALIERFQIDWGDRVKANPDPPGDDTVRNFFYKEAQTTFKYWVIDGFCNLLLDCSLEEWEGQQQQVQDSISESDSGVKFSSAIAYPDWREVCLNMLETQKQSIRRQASEIMSEPFYVQLGLVERKYKPRHDRDFSLTPEQGSRFFHLETEEIIDTYEHNRFLEEVINQGQTKKSHGKRIAIIGEPGAGKTTLLEAIAFSPEAPGLPIWISLGSIGEKTLEEYLRQKWLKEALKTSDVTQQQKALEELFKSGEVVLLLDGVDEMPASSPVEALAKIRKELTGWVADARVVLTCRVNVWDANVYALQGFDTYRTLPLEYGDSNKPDQVKQFICQWFSKTDKPKLGKSLGKKLDANRHQRIRDLAKNPLLLSLLCQSWYFRQGDLPKTKAALYEQFTRAFYDWKDEKITTISTKRKELNEKLALLAREAIDEEKSRFAIRESFALDVMGEDLFNSACKLHWLIHVYNDADTNEKVYAFFHPTFQEYFAALAVYDWEFFLPRAHDNPNPKPVSDRYRIFEPQWKEVILLWLGRPDEEVTKEQKEAFIKKLVNFKDGCTELFYRYQAYFLAAAGIAEFNDFSDCNTSNHIVNEIVKWSFGQTYQVKFPYPHTQESKSPKFVENAAKSMLIETDCKLVITKLSNLLDEEGRSEQNIFEVSSFLLQLSQGNFKAIKKFKYLIQNSQSTEVRKWASLKFLESTPDESDPMFDCAYKILLEPIGGGITRETWERNWEHWTNWSSNRPNCGEDALSRLLSIAREAYNKQNQLENQTKKFILSDMLLKGTTIQEQVQELIEIMETGRNPELHITYIHHLSYIGHGNKKAIQQLIKIVRAYKNQDFYYAAIEGLGLIGIGSREAFDCLLEVIDQGIVPTTAIWSMKNILGGDLFDLAVRQLKHQFLLCYPVIWYCAQNMSYSAFHQAWCE